MLLYIVKTGALHHFVVETMSNYSLSGLDFLVVDKIYQLLDVKTKGRFLVELFDKNNPKTYLLTEMNGKYLFSLEGMSDIMELSKFPDIKQISRESYEVMIKGMESNKDSINLLE